MKNNENTEKKNKNLKKFKYGSMSMVVIVLVVAIVVVINIICGVLTSRYPLKADLTADKRYELCDETIDVLKNLDKDIEITVTCLESDFLSLESEMASMYYYYYGVSADFPYTMIPTILEKYQMYAESSKGSIDVKYVDINKDPDVIAGYKKHYNGEIKDRNIVISTGERVKVLSEEELMSMLQLDSTSYQQGNIVVNFVGESTLTSTIMSVTDVNPVKVAYANMMGEYYVYNEAAASASDSFKELLASNGYECTDVDVMSDEFSTEDYDLIVVPAPSIDFSEDVIAKFEDFLYNDGNYGKNLIYISDFMASELPNLEEFLEKWNIRTEDAYIMDDISSMNVTVNSLGGTLSSPLGTIADEEAVGILPNETLKIVAPFARELTILDKNNEYVTSAVLTSSSTAYTTPFEETAEADSEKGTRNIIVLSKRERAENFDVYTSSVLAIGTAFMADNTIVTNVNSYNNANFLLNMVNTLTGKENSAVIPQKNLQQQTLAIEAKQAKSISHFVIWGIPLVVVMAGVIVFIRRKNR